MEHSFLMELLGLFVNGYYVLFANVKNNFHVYKISKRNVKYPKEEDIASENRQKAILSCSSGGINNYFSF